MTYPVICEGLSPEGDEILTADNNGSLCLGHRQQSSLKEFIGV